MKKDWRSMPLGQLCYIEIGKTPSRGNKSFWDVEKATTNVWLSIADLLNSENNIVTDSKEYISDKGASISKIVKAGTLLASFKLTLGRLAFAGNDLYTNEAIAALKVKNESELSKYFLYYFLSFFDWNAATKGDVKVKGKTLNKEKLKEIEVEFPKSLTEQEHIVTILDESFAAIAKVRENAKKNLQNAREVYASVLENLFAEATNDGNTIEFGELIETLTDYHANGSYEVLKENVELKNTEDFAWMVRSTDFENDFQNDFRYITKAAYEFLAKSHIFGGEIIMSKIGNAGKVYLMPEITRPCSLAMNLFLIRLKENMVNSKYVYRYLKSKRGETQILSKLRGAATQTITKENVRSLQIPLIPKDVQEHLVSKLEGIEAETRRLEGIYQQKLDALEDLKQSILQEAFSGELAAPHLIQQEMVWA